MKALPAALDQLDLDIIARLQNNALTTNKAIAAELNVAESTIGARIRGLGERKLMRVVVMHDIRALGCDLLTHADLYLEGCNARDVAEELAKSDHFTMVSLIAGTPQITVQINARDRAALLEAILKTGEIPGVKDIRTLISLRILKFVSAFGSPLDRYDGKPELPEGADIQARILNIVERDARTGYREIGRMLGVSESLIRKRLKALTDAGAIKFGVMTDPRALGLNCSAFVRLSVAPRSLAQIAKFMTDQPEVSFASLTAGDYNLLSLVTVTDRDALTDLVNRRFGQIEGIHRMDIRELSDVLKSRFNLIRITPTGLR